MKENNFNQDIFEVYLRESRLSLNEIAHKYNVSPEHCGEELQKIQLIYRYYQDLPEHEPSTMTINRIRVYACEEAQRRASRFFWVRLLRPVAAAAALCVLSFVSFHFWQDYRQAQNTLLATSQVTVDSQAQPRTFALPFEQPTYNPQWSVNQAATTPYLNSWAQPASIGFAGQDSLGDELNMKMLHEDLSTQEVEALYYRARKLEKLGYYQQALQDYQFIAKRYPQFEYKKALSLALASCYQNLGDKDAALNTLENYVKQYGKSEDLIFWMDQLKSETF